MVILCVIPGVMWMILAILTIPGWRLWPSISTTQVARRCATRKLGNSIFNIVFANFQVGQLPLQAGDDAGAIQWMPLDAKVVVVTQMRFNFKEMFRICSHLIFQVILYASHKDFVEKVVEKLGAHW